MQPTLMIKAFSIFASLAFFTSCIKPYACECNHLPTNQKSHVLVYAPKGERDEACKKNGKDSTVVCYLK